MASLLQGSLKIYKYPLPDDIDDTTITGGDPALGLFQGLPSNDPVKVLVRVYVVKVTRKGDPTLGLLQGLPINNYLVLKVLVRVYLSRYLHHCR